MFIITAYHVFCYSDEKKVRQNRTFFINDLLNE